MQYDHSANDNSRWPDDVDLVDEISTIQRDVYRSLGEEPEQKVRVFHRPDETIGAILDDEEWDGEYHTPVETTVLVVDEDELITREQIAEQRRIGL